MSRQSSIAIGLTAGLLAGGAFAASPAIKVTNPSKTDWKGAPVVVPWTPALEAAWPRGNQGLEGSGAGPCQQVDLDGDGKVDELVFLADLKAGETKEFRVPGQAFLLKQSPRAHALMSLKGYDGVGWESDVIAYRIYWNLDNAMDIFCKAHPRLSLDGWATPGIPHAVENEYGLDVLKVGRSMGIGGFAGWINGKIEKVSNVMKTHYIRADGPICAVVELEYVFWQPGPIPDLGRQAITSKAAPKYDLTVRMSIFAGQKWGEADILVKPHKGAPMPEIVTGLPKHEETELIRDEKVGILGRWGRQALGDNEKPKAGGLGLGVVVDPATAIAYGEDDFSTYVRIKPVDGRVRYRYHGSWFKEPGGAQSTKDYERMLREVAELHPVVSVAE